VQLLIIFEINRCAKVNDFGEVLSRIKDDVLWLEISMNDSLVVTVRNTLKNLFDGLCCIFLSELLSVNEFVEELKAFA